MATRLLDSLVTQAAPRDREVEADKARERNAGGPRRDHATRSRHRQGVLFAEQARVRVGSACQVATQLATAMGTVD